MSVYIKTMFSVFSHSFSLKLPVGDEPVDGGEVLPLGELLVEAPEHLNGIQLLFEQKFDTSELIKRKNQNYDENASPARFRASPSSRDQQSLRPAGTQLRRW